MKTMDLAPELAEDALVRLAGHVGPTVRLGRPVLAMAGDEPGQVILVTDHQAAWWVTEARASRMSALAGGNVELVDWCDGRETARVIRPAQWFGLPEGID